MNGLERKAEKARLSRVVDVFAEQMKAKLHLKADEGYVGWSEEKNRQDVLNSLLAHTDRLQEGDNGQAVDVANLAMMLSVMGGQTFEPPLAASAQEAATKPGVESATAGWDENPTSPTPQAQEQPGRYRAEFLWSYDEDSLERVAYEFANAATEEGQLEAWKELSKHFHPIPADQPKSGSVSDEECCAIAARIRGDFPLGPDWEETPVECTEAIARAVRDLCEKRDGGWRPYPQEKPEKDGMWMTQLKSGMMHQNLWDSRLGWCVTLGERGNHVIAFRELPAPYTPPAPRKEDE